MKIKILCTIISGTFLLSGIMAMFNIIIRLVLDQETGIYLFYEVGVKFLVFIIFVNFSVRKFSDMERLMK